MTSNRSMWNMFINLSNHPSSKWDSYQLNASRQYGEIVDMPFPQISPLFTDEEMNCLVEEYYNRILQYGEPTVMMQGEFVFVFRLVTLLKSAGIHAIAACSERVVNETLNPDGSRTKVSEFRFVCYREY